jgi:uncharacterized membrane protein
MAPIYTGKRRLAVRKSSEAEITGQLPDLCLAWRSRGVINNEEVVTFRPLSDMESSIQLQIAYHAESIVDVGDLSESLSLGALEDLRCVKIFIEKQGCSTGASWSKN